MTSEEKFNQVVWWVLQEIKKESLVTPKDQCIYFEPQSSDNPNLSVIDQRRALKLLEKEGAISIEREKFPLNIMKMGAELYNWKPIGYYLKILQPKFDELYHFYASGYKEKEQINQTTDDGLTPKREPLHIVIDEVKKDIGIKGLEEKVILQKPKNKRLRLRQFPKDLKWEEITMRFLNEHEVIITARNDTFQIDYDALGFQDEKKKLPNKQWQFLKGLSETGGELSWKSSRATPKGKKQKQLLAETLKAYFQIDEDPFYSYKQEKSYKIRINLIPEVGSKDRQQDDLEIENEYKKQTPSVYDEYEQ